MIIKQVVTELDWMHAIYEYMEEQLDGRFRLQFPGQGEHIDELLEGMSHPFTRINEDTMMLVLINVTAAHGGRLTTHMLKGCPNEEEHEFQKELISLVWDARYETHEWLKDQGIIPGQSCN